MTSRKQTYPHSIRIGLILSESFRLLNSQKAATRQKSNAFWLRYRTVFIRHSLLLDDQSQQLKGLELKTRLEWAQTLKQRLLKFERMVGPVSGILEDANREAFVGQLVDSIHRIEYISAMKSRVISAKRCDPNEPDYFDPLLGSIYAQQQGDTEESFWLVFLFTHFGKNFRGGWRYAREVYGRLGQGGLWDWSSVKQNPSGIGIWIDDNLAQLSRPGGGFGNHRKYESLVSAGAVVQSYVDWVGPMESHHEVMETARVATGGDPVAMFDHLYHSMNAVHRFGRTAKFDYLTMVGKMDLAPIRPGSTYVAQATGPRMGGRIFFGRPEMKNAELEENFNRLAACLEVGPQVIEDAICNWQKSPGKFIAFRG
jgi:hypothetical protein